MGCCLDFESSKTLIEEVVKKYHEIDYKIFVAHRTANEGLGYTVTVGVVVKPDVSKNTLLLEDFIKLGQRRTDVCIKPLTSQIDMRDTRLVDLFLLEIKTEVII